MSTKPRSNRALLGILAVVSVPMLFGAGCPLFGGRTTNGGTTTTTLLSQTVTALPVAGFYFTPTAAGKTITATVTGDVNTSRPAVEIYDPVANLMAQELSPTTSSTVVSFTSTSTGQHTMVVTETSLRPANTYTVLVTEQ